MLIAGKSGATTELKISAGPLEFADTRILSNLSKESLTEDPFMHYIFLKDHHISKSLQQDRKIKQQKRWYPKLQELYIYIFLFYIFLFFSKNMLSGT